MFVKQPLPSIRSALMKSLEGCPGEELQFVQFVPAVCQNEGQCVLYCTIHLKISLLPVAVPALIELNSQPDRSYMCRMQMVLSGHSPCRHPSCSSVSPFLLHSSFFYRLHNYFISTLMKQHLVSEHLQCTGPNLQRSVTFLTLPS